MEKSKYIVKDIGDIDGFHVILEIPESNDDDSVIRQEIISLMDAEVLMQLDKV